ncbi:MAG: ABC transporter ATP-binding protein [Lachnospiraceae bacterium]
MLNIFKFMKKEIGPAIIIVLLLLVQAYCDLSLPQYTSDIVNVGITNYGIDSNVPEVITESTFNYVSAFLDEEDRTLLNDSYEAAGEYKESAYKLKDVDSDTLNRLSDIVTYPLIAVSTLKQSDGGTVEDMLKFMPQEAKKEMLDKIREQMETMGESSVGTMVAKIILEEKDVLGIDPAVQQNSYMWRVGARMIVMAVLIMVVAILVGYLASKVGARIGMRLRLSVFERVVGFSNAEIDKFSTASLITRSTNDIQQVQMVCVMLLRMVAYAPILAIGGIIKVSATKTGLAWIIVAAVAAISVLVIILMTVAMPKFKKMQVMVDRVNLVAREILTGIPVIRAFSREKHEEDRFDGANKDLMNTQLFTQRTMATMMPFMTVIMNLVMIGIVWFGGKGIDAGNMQVGDMMAFMTYTMQIIMSFLMLTMVSIMLPRAGVAANRIAEVINTDSSVIDNEQVVKPQGRGDIVFDNVSFSYPDADEKVLENISFTARAGTTTAIIGSTGNGKSTLINLIPRFYDVTSGRITIDGVDIRDMSQHDLRDMIGYVPQKAVLFSGTINSNIKFGVPDAGEDVVKKAADIAQATEFIEQKEEQFDASIAQGGTNVSGGQKQRLSIARAIAKHPKIYIFDDSFSALDYKTDVTLRNALKKETGDANVIIVAQRISTILHAEQIIVLDDGKIAGCGTHKELMKNCEVYRQIAQSQLSAKDLEDIEKEV